MSETKRHADGNMAAKRLGDLLLRGYRMLDASCPHCNTVLMQARDGQNTCVMCENETSKKIQPEVTETATRKRSVTEMEFEPGEKQSSSGVQRAINVVLNELDHSANQLETERNSSELQTRQELVRHIMLCADTVRNLKTLQT